MEPHEIVDALQKPFPKGALKERKGAGGKTFTYVEGHAAIHRLLDVSPNFDMEYVTHWLYEDIGPNGKDRVTLNVLIYVTIPNLGKRLGHGVAVLGGGEDLAKGALTDAFKNALKYAGQGLSLYGEDYEAPPAPPSIRKQLNDLLKEQGHTDVALITKTKFNKMPKDLTDGEVLSWITEFNEPAELSEKAIPF